MSMTLRMLGCGIFLPAPETYVAGYNINPGPVRFPGSGDGRAPLAPDHEPLRGRGHLDLQPLGA